MAWWKPWEKKETVTISDVAPTPAPSVRAVDVTTTPPGQSGPDRTGGYTVYGGTGSRGGGGSISDVSGMTIQQAEHIEQQTAGLGTPAIRKLPTASTSVTQVKDVKISPSGGVSVGTGKDTRRYVGNAMIPGLGITANAYNKRVRADSVSSGQISIKDYGRTSFVGTDIFYPNNAEVQPPTSPSFGVQDSVIDVAPSFSQRWKENTAYRGYLGGSFETVKQSILGGYAKAEWFAERKIPGYETYQAPATSNLLGFGYDVGKVYGYIAVPGGSFVFLGEQVENLGSQYGVTQRSYTERALTEGNYGFKLPSGAAKFGAYVPQVAMIGLGVVAAKADIARIKSITTQEELAQLSQQPLKFKELQIAQGDTSLTQVGASRSFKGLTQDISLTGKITKVGESSFVLPRGSGFSTTSGELTGTRFWSLKGTKVLSLQQFDFGIKGFSLPMGEQVAFSFSKYGIQPTAEWTTTYKMGYGPSQVSTGDSLFSSLKKEPIRVTTQGKTTTGYSWGLSNKLKNNWFVSIGGEAEALDVYPSLNAMNVIGKPGSFGFTKVVRITKPTGGISSFSGGGQSLSGPFTSQVSPIIQGITSPTIIIPKTSTQTIMGGVIASIKTPSGSFSIPGIVATSEKTKQTVIPIVASLSATVMKAKTKNKLLTPSIQKFGQIPVIKQKNLQGLLPATKTATIQKTITRGGFPVPTGSFAPRFTPPPPGTIPFLPFILPFGGERSGGLGRLKASRTYSYFPSFKAFAFGIRGKGTKPLATKRWTGLEVRPLYSKSSRTRKSRLPRLILGGRKLKRKRNRPFF